MDKKISMDALDENKKAYCTIIEDCVFSAGMIYSLAIRDIRVRISGTLTSQIDPDSFNSLERLVKDTRLYHGSVFSYSNIDPELIDKMDTILLDSEVPHNKGFPLEIMKKISNWKTPLPKVICTCTIPLIEELREFKNLRCFSGYLVKSEVLYCISSAIYLAHEGYKVITPSVAPLLKKIEGDERKLNKFKKAENFRDFSEALIIESPRFSKITRLPNIEKREKDIERLSLLFSLSKAEIANELECKKTNNTIPKIVSQKYSKLKIPQLVAKKTTLKKLFKNSYMDNTQIIDEFQPYINAASKRRVERRTGVDRRMPKPELESELAFHLETCRPTIKRFRRKISPAKMDA